MARESDTCMTCVIKCDLCLFGNFKGILKKIYGDFNEFFREF